MNFFWVDFFKCSWKDFNKKELTLHKKCVTSYLCGPWAYLWLFYGLYCKQFIEAISCFSHTNSYIWNVTNECWCLPMLVFRAWATCGIFACIASLPDRGATSCSSVWVYLLHKIMCWAFLCLSLRCSPFLAHYLNFSYLQDSFWVIFACI